MAQIAADLEKRGIIVVVREGRLRPARTFTTDLSRSMRWLSAAVGRREERVGKFLFREVTWGGEPKSRDDGSAAPGLTLRPPLS